MTKKIPLTNFSQGFDISIFHTELLASTFSSKVLSVADDTINAKINLSELLNSGELIELDEIILNHVRVAKSEIESNNITESNGYDYLASKEYIKTLYSDFDTLTLNEKKVVSKYCLEDPAINIAFYVSLGYSSSESINMYLATKAVDIKNVSAACKNRVENPVMSYILLKHVSPEDALKFFKDTLDLIESFIRFGHFGRNYNADSDGILDYIEATNTFENAGLSTYYFVNSSTYEACRDEIKSYIHGGVVPSEWDSTVSTIRTI